MTQHSRIVLCLLLFASSSCDDPMPLIDTGILGVDGGVSEGDAGDTGDVAVANTPMTIDGGVDLGAAIPDDAVIRDAVVDAQQESAPASLSVTPAMQLFGSTGLGETSRPTTFTIWNTGGRATGALVAALFGGNIDDFHILQDQCTGIALLPKQSCTLQVEFAPLSSFGERSTSLIVRTDTGVTAVSVLGGSAIIVDAHLVIQPSFWDFGSMTLSQTGEQSFSVETPAIKPTGNLVLSVDGANAADFTVVDDACSGRSIVARTNCSLTISFRPGAIGVRTGFLTIGANPGGTTSVAFTGTGIPTPE